jgi:hypothetical protein
MDRWKIALDIEMVQWIEALPDHIQIDYVDIPSGLIDT